MQDYHCEQPNLSTEQHALETGRIGGPMKVEFFCHMKYQTPFHVPEEHAPYGRWITISVPPGRHLLCSLHRNLALVTVIRANENLDPSATKHSNGRVHAASRRHISMNQMYQVLRQTYRITSLTQ